MMTRGLRKGDVTSLAVRLQGIAAATRLHAGYLPISMRAEVLAFYTVAEQLELEATQLLDAMRKQREAARNMREILKAARLLDEIRQQRAAAPLKEVPDEH